MSHRITSLAQESVADSNAHLELLEGTRAYLASRLRRQTPEPQWIESWERFYQVYDPLISRFAISCGVPAGELNDCRQEVWKALVTTLPNFRHEASRGGFRSWLFCLVRRKTIDVIRRRTRHPTEHLDCDWEAAIPARDTDPADHYEQQCEREIVQTALAELRHDVSADTFQVLQMWWIDGRTVAEIAADLGLTPQRIWQRVYRAKQKLRYLLLQRTRND